MCVLVRNNTETQFVLKKTPLGTFWEIDGGNIIQMVLYKKKNVLCQ